MQNSNDEDTLASRRRVKQHKSWRTEGTRAWENASQKNSQDAVFNSDSGSEKATAKQLSPQQAQSEQMYLRRGRSYSRARNSTDSESEVFKFGAYCTSDEDGVSAFQAPEGKIQTRLNRKHLQRVVQREKRSTPCSDSDTSSTQSQVQKSADSDHLFTPPVPRKGCRRKALVQKSKLVPPIVTMSEIEDSRFSTQQGNVTNKKNTRRQKKVPQNYDNYVKSDAGDESLPSELIREDKSKNSKPTLKRTRQREHAGASERTTNGHALLVDKHPEQSEKTDNPQFHVSNNTGRKPKSSVSRRNKKEQTAKHPEIEQDALEGAWTDKELHKLTE